MLKTHPCQRPSGSTPIFRQQGFTLLEIMVVIVILGLLVAVVAPNVLQNQDKAMVQKTRADIAIAGDRIPCHAFLMFTYGLFVFEFTKTYSFLPRVPI